jgi:hypothetical protein
MKLRSFAVVAVVIAAGCYNPTFKNDIACDPAGACPPGTACGTDGKCHGPGGDVSDAPTASPDASGGLDIDASTIDAKPVDCANDAECQSPPDLCSTAGACDGTTHRCVFPAIDCSAMNDPCNRGVCEASTGHCVKAPANTTFTCAATTCGGFSACAVGTCDASGQQTRQCAEHKCQSGACQENDYAETVACNNPSPPTDATACGPAPTVTACTVCGGFNGPCGESGTMSCTCTTQHCSGGACVTVQTSCQQDCSRDTDDNVCQSCASFREKICQGGQCVITDC